MSEMFQLLKIGALTGRVEFTGDQSDIGIRDDLGLERSSSFVAERLAPQVTVRVQHLGYFAHMTAAVNFAQQQIHHLKDELGMKDPRTLRNRFLFWMDCYELCLAWTLKGRGEKGFIGVDKLGSIEKMGGLPSYLNGLSRNCWDARVAFSDEFMTSRGSYAFDRHKGPMVIMGLVEPMFGVPGAYTVRSRDVMTHAKHFLPQLPDSVPVNMLNFPSARDAAQAFFKNYFSSKSSKRIRLSEKRFANWFWENGLFSESALRQGLKKLSNFGLEEPADESVIKNIIAVRKQAEATRGGLRTKWLEGGDVGLALGHLSKVDIKDVEAIHQWETLKNLLLTLNFLLRPPRELVTKLTDSLKTERSIGLSVFERQVHQAGYFEAQKFYVKKNVRSILERYGGTEIADILGFLVDLYGGPIQGEAAARHIVNVLNGRIRNIKEDLSGDAFFLPDDSEQIEMPSEEYRKRIAGRGSGEVRLFTARLEIFDMMYRQSHENK